MKRITTCRAVLSAVALCALTSSCPVFAQSANPDSADPTANAIEVLHADAGRSGYDPVNISFPLSTAWRRSGAAHKANPASMVCEDGTIYYGSDTNLVAVRLSDGQQRWSTAIPSDGRVLSTPAISGAFLYVGSSKGMFYKISRADGSIIWSFKSGTGILSSPVVSGGMVYFGSQDTNCYALNADTGKPVWQFATNAPVNTAPSVSGGLAVFISSDYNVYSFSAITGRPGWTIQLPDDPTVGPPAISGSSITMCAGPWIYSFTAHSGSLRWKARFDDNIVSSATVGPSGVFVATADHKVYGLSDRGQIRWTKTVGAAPGSGMLLTQNSVVVGTAGGALYAFDPSSGNMLWDYAVQPDTSASVTSTKITGQPIYVGGTLLALSDDGALTAFRNDVGDSSPPKLSAQLPKPGDIVAGKGLAFSANVIDYASGIDPSSVQFLLDGGAIPGGHYDADSNGVVADTAKAKLLNLINGTHIVTVKAKDWRGNALAQTWGFTVDRKLNPKDTDDTIGDVVDPGTVPSGDTATPTPAPMNNNNGGGGNDNPPAGNPPPPPVF